MPTKKPRKSPPKPKFFKESTVESLIKALCFYADPKTYFAIGFFADPPCGDMMKDFTETEYGEKPGKLGRETLNKLLKREPRLSKIVGKYFDTYD